MPRATKPSIPAVLALAGTMLAVAVGVCAPAGADPRRPLPLVLQDDAELLNRSPDRVRADLRTARALGVSVIRLTASWSRIAPDPMSTRRPGPPFRPEDPRTYPPGAWDHLDRAVAAAHAAGLRVLVDVAFWAPRWAVHSTGDDPARPRDTPDPRAFSAFASAVARRYSGDARPAGARVPRVSLFAVWNEPNHPSFLAPQWRRRADGGYDAASPGVYRPMYVDAARALRRASPGATVLLGNLAAIGGPPGTAGVPPLAFLRSLACVDRDLRPRTDGDCAGYRPLRADGVAFHPYTRYVTPGTRADGPDRVRLVDLGRLRALVDRLRRTGRLDLPAGDPLWITEYGYETREDDPYQPFTRADQARFMGWSTYLAWRTPGVASMAQFQLRDIDPAETGLPRSDRRRYRDFQSGVLDRRGRPKPGAGAMMLPFWPRILGHGGRRRLWLFAQIRPGGAGPAGPGQRTFAVQRWDAASRSWRPVSLWACGAPRPGCGRAPGAPVDPPVGERAAGATPASAWAPAERTDDNGVAVRTAPALGAGPYRLMWERRPGRWIAGPPVRADERP